MDELAEVASMARGADVPGRAACRPSWSLAGVVAVICCGLVLLVAGETSFDLVTAS